MAEWLIDRLQENAQTALQEGLKACGVAVQGDLRLLPPADPSMGDLGLPCHPYAKALRKAPTRIAEEIAAAAPRLAGIGAIEALNGYVNLRFDPLYILQEGITEVWQAKERLGTAAGHRGERLLIEFSGPNTNKPQHLGHVRNNVLGLAMSRILEAVGYEVIRANIINDRGIHICKSMLAYQRFGGGSTPQSTGMKGDFFVGHYYVLFDQKLQEEFAAWKAKNPEQASIDSEAFFKSHSELGAAAQEMLRRWEAGEPDTVALWKQMNSWVYEGFDVTYGRLGIHFDWVDYESDTYLLGKDVVLKGREQGVFVQREDHAVICDLETIGLSGQKVLLRPDGTSVYMTQDLGTAIRRLKTFDPKSMIYVVADEQNYHFQVLFGLLNRLEAKAGDRCRHLSYGMVDLPHGRMKSREGTVVDADSLMDELQGMALEKVNEHSPDLQETAKLERAEKVGQAGLKFYLLKFSPASRIRFNPEESISFEGETGPYCLYSYARVNSIEAKTTTLQELPSQEVLKALQTPQEIEVGKLLIQFPRIVREAGEDLNPSRLALYLCQLGRAFSSFYQHPDHRIIDAESPLREARLALAKAVQAVIGRGLYLLGIDVIEQM